MNRICTIFGGACREGAIKKHSFWEEIGKSLKEYEEICKKQVYRKHISSKKRGDWPPSLVGVPVRGVEVGHVFEARIIDTVLVDYAGDTVYPVGLTVAFGAKRNQVLREV